MYHFQVLYFFVKNYSLFQVAFKEKNAAAQRDVLTLRYAVSFTRYSHVCNGGLYFNRFLTKSATQSILNVLGFQWVLEKSSTKDGGGCDDRYLLR